MNMVFDGKNFYTDSWHIIEDIETNNELDKEKSIVFLKDLEKVLSCSIFPEKLGVFLSDADEISTFFSLSPAQRLRIRLVRLCFSSPTDGRAFSHARHIRRNGYNGVLRACGHSVPDLSPFIFAVGFDEIEVDCVRFPPSHWHESIALMPLSYQHDLRV